MEALPSTASPTGTPSSSISGIRAMPEESFMLLMGQWATPVPVLASTRSSSSLKWMPWANHTSLPVQPKTLHVLQRADALPLEHEVLLVLGLTQVGVQPHAVLAGQNGALAQQLRRHGEGRAGSQSDAVHGSVGGVVVLLNEPGGVRHDAHPPSAPRCPAVGRRP